jgi:hypothetical protein
MQFVDAVVKAAEEVMQKNATGNWMTMRLAAMQESSAPGVRVNVFPNPFSEVSAWLHGTRFSTISDASGDWIASRSPLLFSQEESMTLRADLESSGAWISENSALFPLRLGRSVWGVLLLECESRESLTSALCEYWHHQSRLLSSSLETRILRQELASQERISRWLAHEVRNPLTGLLGLSSILSMDLEIQGSLPTSDMQELIGMVSDQGRRIVTLLDLVRGMAPDPFGVAARYIPMGCRDFSSLLTQCVTSALKPIEVVLPQADVGEIRADVDAFTESLVAWVRAVHPEGIPGGCTIQSDVSRITDPHWADETSLLSFVIRVLGLRLGEVETNSVGRWVSPELSVDTGIEIATLRLRGLTEAHGGWLNISCESDAVELEFILPDGVHASSSP